MRTCLAVFACVLALALPTHAAAPQVASGETEATDAPVRLVRYAYEVSWEGGSPLNRQGKVGVAVLADLEHDQQQLQLVRDDGYLMGRMVQQGTIAFGGATGQNMEPTFDLMVGMQMLGVPVGLASFIDWAQAQDSRGPLAKAVVSRNTAGVPESLEEDGWKVYYSAWAQASGTAMDVPAQWSIEHESGLVMRLTLVAAEAYSNDTLPQDYNPIQIR